MATDLSTSPTTSPTNYKLDHPQGGRKSFIIGVVGLVLCVVGFFVNRTQFFHSYLTAFAFWTTVSLGAFFFTMLHHLTGARWSVVLRRIPEALMMNLPRMALFFLPILFFGMHELYEWTHHEVVAKDALLTHKAAYLNMTFFVIRLLLYFGVWWFLTRALYRTSLRQDQGDTPQISESFQRLSAPGMILFALTLTFSGIDWLMSLSPHWFSTMFGVYIFAGSVLSSLAMITMISLNLQRQGVLRREITIEHYHDLGKLMFAFTIFWSYITFCQYLLIWYSNIPEETVWFFNRWQGSWKGVSLLIVIGHFVLPFLVLLPRATKRSRVVLWFITSWLLFMHWVDLHWIVMPQLHKQGIHLGWMDLVTMFGIGGIYVSWFRRRFFRNPVLAIADPRLAESLKFENA